MTVSATAPAAAGRLTDAVDGEPVMLDIDSGNYVNLDSIGAAIWGLLEDPVRFGDLCQGLHTRYDAPLETLRTDVAVLLSGMPEHRLVRTEMP